METLMKLEADKESASEVVFHLARNSFNGLGNINSNNGFKLITLNPRASEAHAPSEPSQKSDIHDLAETGFDAEISFKSSFQRIGAGLRNLGNTCFLNSVLQCLTYTEPLAAYLQSGKHQSSCRTAGFCALCAIQNHVSRALQSTGRILEPIDLVSNLRCISRRFRNARQEDAHEYMVNLLESMHKCCLPSGVPSESSSAYERSLVHKIFGGRLRSQVKCMQCSSCSDKFDPFLDLSLEIEKADSLYKALAHFTAKEQLDGGAKEYQCEQCRQKVRALKQLTIYKAPHVLAIHLKRFGSHVQGQKIDKNINFGPTLDLTPFVTGSYDGDLKYTLYGVLVHAGWSSHSGHYYCFVRTSSGMWYSLDDNQVFLVSERKVLEQKAYMLFYVRDRTSFCAKKPVDVGSKANMAMNTTQKAEYSESKPEFGENEQNGLPEKRPDGSFSAALSQKDAPINSAPKETPEKLLSQNVNETGVVNHTSPKKGPQSELRENIPNESLQKRIDGYVFADLSEKNAPIPTEPKETPSKKLSSPNVTETVAVNHTSPKTNPQSEPSLMEQPTKDFGEVHSAISTNSVSHQAESSSIVDHSGDALNTSHPAKVVNCNNKFSVVQDIINSHKQENDVGNNDSANENPSESAKESSPISNIHCPSSEELCNMSSTSTGIVNKNPSESAKESSPFSDVHVPSSEELCNMSSTNTEIVKENPSESAKESSPISNIHCPSSEELCNMSSTSTGIVNKNPSESAKESSPFSDVHVPSSEELCNMSSTNTEIVNKNPSESAKEPSPISNIHCSSSEELCNTSSTSTGIVNKNPSESAEEPSPISNIHYPPSEELCNMGSTDTEIVNKNPSESAKEPSPISNIHCSLSEELCNISSADTEMYDGRVMHVEMSEGSNKIVNIQTSKKTSSEEPQVESYPMSNNSTLKVDLQLSSDGVATAEHLLCGLSKRKRPMLFKSPIANMQLSSNIIYDVAFKKKQKRRKYHSTSMKQSLSKNNLPSDLGTSTSCKSSHLPIGHCIQSPRKRAKCDSDDKSVHKEKVNDVINDELRKRVRPNETMLSNEKQPNTRQSVVKETCVSEDHKRELRQASMMSILTRGLEETTIARWGCTDVPHFEKVEPGVQQNAKIGYIGDEWDEEYDRGKRKKIRHSNISFGGPNLFQAIAPRKIATTKKMNRSASENHPFRI